MAEKMKTTTSTTRKKHTRARTAKKQIEGIGDGLPLWRTDGSEHARAKLVLRMQHGDSHPGVSGELQPPMESKHEVLGKIVVGVRD